MDVYKSTFYFTVYILITLRIFAVGLSALVYLMFVCRALSVCFLQTLILNHHCILSITFMVLMSKLH